MGERRTYSREIGKIGKKAGAFLLATSLLVESSPVTELEPPQMTNHDASRHTSLKAFDYSSNVLAMAELDFNSGVYKIRTNTLPPQYSEPFEEGLQIPLMQLGGSEAASSLIVVREVDPWGERASPIENGWYMGTNKIIDLDISTVTESRGEMFQNPLRITDVLNHEMLHALDNDWYSDIANRENGEDDAFFTKAKELVTACYALNKDILSQYMKLYRESVADTFEAADMATIATQIHSENPLFPLQHHPKSAIAIGAAAIRNDDPRIYTTPQMFYPICEQPDIRYVFANVADIDINTLLSSYSDKSGVESMQYTLSRTAAWAYRCMNEGPALFDITGDESAEPIGHSETNMTEMASSIINALLVNPHYILQCLEGISARRAAMFRRYIYATVDMVLYRHPQIEAILRQNQSTSDVLDILWQPSA